MICDFCGKEIKKKNLHNRKKEGAACDKCYDIYIKQNRQMSIETAVYGLHFGGHNV